jgi:hypothetical protein
MLSTSRSTRREIPPLAPVARCERCGARLEIETRQILSPTAHPQCADCALARSTTPSTAE